MSRNTLLRAGVIQILADVVPNVRLMGFSYHDLDRYPDPAQSIDLLLISIASPERLTSLVTAGLRAFLPQKVILLSESTPDYSAISALPRQVSGFIDQAAPAEVFVDSVRRVLSGHTCFPWDQNIGSVGVENNHALPNTSIDGSHSELGTSMVSPAQAPKAALAAPSRAATLRSSVAPSASVAKESELLGLTRRQYEVLVLLSRGHALKSVARILDISLGTTKAHTESVYQRLGAHNRNQAVYLARSKGASLNWEPTSNAANSNSMNSEAESGPDTPSMRLR
ncbi:response regulator transcription factor [Pusillimonas sp. DMV24BSW_D]|uniref:response regulator transcription factor n=1 Tax=Neopusillimonas aestuarii TaxID=2716226 RepID=UPI00140DDB12|nr:LuxR C-terminal-related transcriptional regulator [Pusillimonas sp. DMV24BSW_D]QIM49748.1 response regulator transcription factor [Pusillimonas sp. DMV24BSW_D]